jgi:hypothetical protein
MICVLPIRLLPAFVGEKTIYFGSERGSLGGKNGVGLGGIGGSEDREREEKDKNIDFK